MSSSGIIDTSKKNDRGLFDSTLTPVEDKSMFMSNSHEFVDMFVMFLVILSMNNYIICNANHSIAVGKDLVNHSLEDVLGPGQVPREADKPEPTPWCVEGNEQ